MATYRVTGPDGSIHQITAPDSASPREVQAYVERQLGKAPQGQGVLNSLHGAASSALDGALPGAGGVASGLLGMAGNAIAAPFSSSVDFDPAGSFRSSREASERHEERFKQDHPNLGATATAAGFVGGLALPVTKLGLGAKGAQVALKGRTLNAAANGALYGGAGGLLDSHAGSPGDALRDTARGALTGGAMGGAMPSMGRLAAPVTHPIAEGMGRIAAPTMERLAAMVPPSVGRRFKNRAAILGANPANAQASRYVGHQMDKAGMDSAALTKELRRRQAMGVPAVPADVNEHLREAYGSATRRPGPATMAVRKAIDDRQRQMSERVSTHVEATLGPATNVEPQAATLSQQARAAAAPLYARSNAEPIPFTQELQTLFAHPDAKSAINVAGKQIWADAIRNGHADPRAALKANGLREQPDGSFEIADVPPMAMYDHAKTAFDSAIYHGEGYNAAPEVNRAGKATNDLRSRLLGIMDGDGITPGLNPHWKPARQAYAGPTQNRKALELGEQMAKDDATDAGNRMADMTGSQIDNFRLGHRSGMVRDLQALGDYGNAARKVEGSLSKRSAIETVHGPDKAEALFDRLAAEHEAYQTWSAVRGNSMTAGREVADQIAAQEQALADTGRGIWAAVRGRPLDALKHAAGAFSGEPARTNAVNDRVSTMLSEQDPQALRKALQGVRRAAVADRAANAASVHRGQQVSKVLGARIGAGAATPPPGQALLGYGQDEDGSTYPVFGDPGTDLGAGYQVPDPR
ncbi:hypothetical protein [uncultured Sphingomonas sp.]|uniref:hypothetical protein n=1 Tax=uncultured Sphingomonas sp. TaxID=158754 RepID=UPI0025F5A347|nr:hypothetical protein [uncultured Sphingomonas sp.]